MSDTSNIWVTQGSDSIVSFFCYLYFLRCLLVFKLVPATCMKISEVLCNVICPQKTFTFLPHNGSRGGTLQFNEAVG